MKTKEINIHTIEDVHGELRAVIVRDDKTRHDLIYRVELAQAADIAELFKGNIHESKISNS